MSKTYLDHTHPDAFVDHTKIAKPEGPYKPCPRCQCHGGWNLTLNAYSLPAGVEDTAENRRRHVHFRCICSHCQGYGWVHESVDCPGHNWVHHSNLGRCYNRYMCTVCGKFDDVDSSD